jgi:UDPglucose 6-dehydrogenase
MAATSLQKGKNLMLEYGTVSKRLADGLVLLLQSVGVVPSMQVRWMTKSTQPAYILRVSGYEQMRALADVLGVVRGAKIERVLAGYQGHIRQHGFQREDGFALVKVREVQREKVCTDVYSLETTTGTVIVGPAIVCHNCFPKDVTALMFMSNKVGLPSQMMDAVHRINEAQKQVLFAKIQRHYGDALKDKTLAIWGLAFKPHRRHPRSAEPGAARRASRRRGEVPCP